jgi:PKHD-type hydroxylase
MISNYLKSKNIINQIPSKINEEELKKDSGGGFYYLNISDYSTTFYYYRNLFNSYEIDKIIATCNKLPQVDGKLGSYNSILNKENRNSVISWVNINEETKWLYEKLTGCILDVNKSFFEYDLTRIEILQFTRYYGSDNGLYCPHTDCNVGHSADNRKLSFVMQLSDPKDYEGGELRLHQGRTPDIVPKEKGLITFFPSHVLHECTPVTSGVRYTLVGWIYGPKFR